MAYTTIDDPTIFFNTVLYAGDNSTSNAITGVGFQPDWIWLKNRSATSSQLFQDQVRGKSGSNYLYLQGNDTAAEAAQGDDDGLNTIGSDGFTVGYTNSVGWNASGNNYVSWNWLAGGTAPSQTYTVKVVSDSGNKYRFDDFGTSAVTLDLQEGGTYTFDQSDSSNSGHPLRFSTTSDGTHGGGSEYTTGVTTTGTPGSSGAKTVITVAASAPTLYYYCSVHSGMGGQANTNSTFGSSNFSGSVQSTVSANSTAGLSIVTATTPSSGNYTTGHGLSSAPEMIWSKGRDSSIYWSVFASPVVDTNRKYLQLSSTNALATSGGDMWGSALPTSSVVGLSAGNSSPASESFVLYCFHSVKGYSKIGKFTGNGNANGTFVYTGFKPAYVFVKKTSSTGHWVLIDNKRDPFNVTSNYLLPDNDTQEASFTDRDLLSNGFKMRNSNTDRNDSGATYIYMAFAESPFVNSNGVPTNAR